MSYKSFDAIRKRTGLSDPDSRSPPSSIETDPENLSQVSLNMKKKGSKGTQELTASDVTTNASADRISSDDKSLASSVDVATPSTSGSPSTKKVKGRSKFRQQELSAWQPVIHSGHSFIPFLLIALFFMGFGVYAYLLNDEVGEYSYDYTDCKSGTGKTCADVLSETNTNQPNTWKTCQCIVDIILEQFQKPVYIYYGLSNFHQNHRSYIPSRDDYQLHGDSFSDYSQLDSDCKPFRSTEGSGNKGKKGIAPCGIIANSMFNDTFIIIYDPNGKNESVGLIKKGIAWSTDKDVKFNNPKSWASYEKPPNWKHKVSELDPNDPDNNGYENEDFIVWMRTATLPLFRKFYRIVDHSGTFSDGLPAGKYTLVIEYNFPVTQFDGRKNLIISTTSWMGGKNMFLPITYMCVGFICLILSIFFAVIHFVWSKKHTNEMVIQAAIQKTVLPPRPLSVDHPLSCRDSTPTKFYSPNHSKTVLTSV